MLSVFVSLWLNKTAMSISDNACCVLSAYEPKRYMAATPIFCRFGYKLFIIWIVCFIGKSYQIYTSKTRLCAKRLGLRVGGQEGIEYIYGATLVGSSIGAVVGSTGGALVGTRSGFSTNPFTIMGKYVLNSDPVDLSC